MKKKKLLGIAVAAACVSALVCGGILAGCSGNASTASSAKAGEHEPITICAPTRNVKDFIDVVHEKYPEIVFNVDSYAGANSTAYMFDQLMSGNEADIYSISYYLGSRYDLSDKLIDLSGYSFVDNYVSSRLREVNEDGAVYLLPSYYKALGITYNKKILEENGWDLPTSLQELEELAPKVEAAGYRLALNEIGLPGYGFQYLCNVLDTGYLSTMDGRTWQNDFLDGKTTLQGNAEMMQGMQLLQRWRDIGMLNGEMEGVDDGAVVDEMVKGNTLFMLGTTNSIKDHGGNVEDFGLMPYLSEDGSQNVYILNVARYMGLSKKLQEPGNEQKLEDALHVMEVLSSREGLEALNSNYVVTDLSPLKDAPNVEGSFYTDIVDDINAGYTAPFIYSGWDNVIVPYGNKMISFISGETSLDDLVAYIDANQNLITDTPPSYATVNETITTQSCARLVGIAFAQAAGADLSLVSLGGMDPETGSTNGEGVNGSIFPMPLTEQEVCMITPTGWHGTITTVTLSGKRVKELAETGYNRKDRGYNFPYLMVTRDGAEIADDATYTVAICGVTDDVKAEGNAQDTGIVGLDVMKDYLGTYDVLTNDNIVWK